MVEVAWRVRWLIPCVEIGIGAAFLAGAVTQQLFKNIAIHGTPFSDWQHYAMAWNRVLSGGSPSRARSRIERRDVRSGS